MESDPNSLFSRSVLCADGMTIPDHL